jgi:hypothetical protein
MRRCRARAVIFITFLLYACGFACNASDQHSTAVQEELQQFVAQRIVECVEDGKEVVLFQSALECVDYRTGNDYFPSANVHSKTNIDAICQNKNDWRRVPANIIQMIAQRKLLHKGAEGIRVLGAAFCHDLNLVGIDVPYSVVLDFSIFAGNVEVRNFHTQGDFSIEDGVILGQMRIARSKIDGTLFGTRTIFKKLLVLDAGFGGSIILRQSINLEPVVFDTVSVVGELGLTTASFRYLYIQFSKIGAVLDLTESQARCGYHISKSEIGDLVAVNFGFGRTEDDATNDSDETQIRKDRYQWRNRPYFLERLIMSGQEIEKLIISGREKNKSAQQSLEVVSGKEKNNTARESLKEKRCLYPSIVGSQGTFWMKDIRVKSYLCLRDFVWFDAAKEVDAESRLTLDDVNVGTTAQIALGATSASGGTSASGATPTLAAHHLLQIVGLETPSFVFDFGQRAYHLSLSGLKFEHVYAVDAKSQFQQCNYDSQFYEQDTKEAPRSANDDLPFRLRFPTVDEVMTWLNSNSIATTQPFTTFVDVFQRHGEDKDAKQLKIAKASAELCFKAHRVFGDWIFLFYWQCKHFENGQVASQAATTSAGFFETIGDTIAIAFGTTLAIVADHGYRPEKAISFLFLSLIAFWFEFWFHIKIIGIKPKDKRIILPVGFLFLFDRLLPAYRIREDHYNIEAFFKRAPKGAKKSEIRRMNFHWFTNIPVVLASADERQAADRRLDILKIIGLLLAIFLVAAINTLVYH